MANKQRQYTRATQSLIRDPRLDSARPEHVACGAFITTPTRLRVAEQTVKNTTLALRPCPEEDRTTL